ncbi:hypothetical protein ACWEG1_06120 [Streptomyces bauhiniae]
MSRRLAGWGVLALIPLTLVALAALAGQLVELGVGAVIAVFIILAGAVGTHLVAGDERRPN